MSNLKFMEACLKGEALLEDIEDYVERWHKSETDETIYDFLGMSEEEYGLWVENDSLLKSIFFARRSGISIMDFLQKDNGKSLAARSSSPEEAAFVLKWLVRTGRIKE